MARTTVDIDGPILHDLKRLQKERGEPLGRLISELLAEALAQEKKGRREPRAFRWKARPMGLPRVDLRDKEAVRAVLDADGPFGTEK